LAAGKLSRKDSGMLSHRSASWSTESQRELLDELESALEWLCRRCPDDLRAEAAHEVLVELRPRVKEAIQALDLIKERRRLTEEELIWRRVFMLLLNAGR
jgi:hypothetical protein